MRVRNGANIVAVDGGKLSIFRNIGEAFEPVLELIEELRNPVPTTAEIGDDRPGRSFQSASMRRSAHERTDLHQKEEDRFARQAAERIESLAKTNKEDLVLVAAPRMLGEIRKLIDSETKDRLTAEISKSFDPSAAESLAKMLSQHQE